MSEAITVGIVGASGYSGAELLRLLLAHPQAEVCVITSRQYAKQRLDAVFPNLRGVTDLCFSDPQDADVTDCQIVFFATPHGVCMREAPALLERGVRIIDFSGDFRLRDAVVFERWYDMPHSAPELLREAVYGLPEIHRQAIAEARLVANPGCYPTAVQIGLKPLLTADALLGDEVIADVKSGVSGAGRSAKQANLFAEIEGSFKAYGASGHRHQPEIEQALALLAARAIDCTFVPHLVPMVRGIEATLYVPLRDQNIDVQALFERAYADEAFVDVLVPGSHPETRHVRGTNSVHIGVHRSVNQRTAIISVVEDNLIKGAAGQAVQSMNVMFGLAETSGLLQPAQMP